MLECLALSLGRVGRCGLAGGEPTPAQRLSLLAACGSASKALSRCASSVPVCVVSYFPPSKPVASPQINALFY